MKRALCVLVLGLCVWTTPARAEQAAGTLEGHAADSSGARLPGVTVEVAKEGDARAIASTTTGEDGSYRFASLAPGAYVIRCALQGFSTSHAAVRIEAGATATITVTLDLAGLSESVQVTATEIARRRTNRASQSHRLGPGAWMEGAVSDRPQCSVLTVLGRRRRRRAGGRKAEVSAALARALRNVSQEWPKLRSRSMLNSRHRPYSFCSAREMALALPPFGDRASCITCEYVAT